MKYQILLLFILVCAGTSYAQVYTANSQILATQSTTTTNVGIGTDNPPEKLSVIGNISVPLQKALGVGPSGDVFTYDSKAIGNYSLGWYSDSWNAAGPSAYLSSFGGLKFFTARTAAMVINQSGNVGIGVANPTDRLVVGGNTSLGGNVSLPLQSAFGFGVGSDTFSYDGKTVGNYGLGWYTDSWQTGAPSMYVSGFGGIKFFTNRTARIVITTSGDVGIGTVDPKGYRLAVAGRMIAEEVNVKLQSAWPDYVFDSDYTVPSLADLNAYIRMNRHLPGVPSAAEVKDKGIDLGAMDAVLLKKIEELTLYVLQQQKEIEELRKQIQSGK